MAATMARSSVHLLLRGSHLTWGEPCPDAMTDPSQQFGAWCGVVRTRSRPERQGLVSNVLGPKDGIPHMELLGGGILLK